MTGVNYLTCARPPPASGIDIVGPQSKMATVKLRFVTVGPLDDLAESTGYDEVPARSQVLDIRPLDRA